MIKQKQKKKLYHKENQYACIRKKLPGKKKSQTFPMFPNFPLKVLGFSEVLLKGLCVGIRELFIHCDTINLPRPGGKIISTIPQTGPSHWLIA